MKCPISSSNFTTPFNEASQTAQHGHASHGNLNLWAPLFVPCYQSISWTAASVYSQLIPANAEGASNLHPSKSSLSLSLCNKKHSKDVQWLYASAANLSVNTPVRQNNSSFPQVNYWLQSTVADLCVIIHASKKYCH